MGYKFSLIKYIEKEKDKVQAKKVKIKFFFKYKLDRLIEFVLMMISLRYQKYRRLLAFILCYTVFILWLIDENDGAGVTISMNA